MSSKNLSKAVGNKSTRAPLVRDKNVNIDVSIAEQRAYEFLVRQQEAKEWIEEMISEKMPPGVANFSDNLVCVMCCYCSYKRQSSSNTRDLLLFIMNLCLRSFFWRFSMLLLLMLV